MNSTAPQLTAETPTLPAWKKKLPMWLTWARVAVCPLLVLLLLGQDPMYGWIAAGLFILASITDWLDGSLARKYKVESTMGKFMDPIADKILVSTVLIMLIPSGRVGPVMVLILLGRDILIGGIRSVAAADRVIIAAKPTGKWKTALQMVAIPALLIYTPVFQIPLHAIGYWLMWGSVVLSLLSGFEYTYGYFKGRRNLTP